jgi:hypothetical protein
VVLLKPDTSVQQVLALLNSFHPSIAFTYEEEEHGSIAFLDVKVIRCEASKKIEADASTSSSSAKIFQTTIHRKETFTGLMTNWSSFVPFSYKKASVVSMIQRAISICSTYSLLTVELDRIREICRLNGYPSSFVDTRIGIGITKYLKKTETIQSKPTEIGCAKRRMFVEIPYVGEQTETLKKQINRFTTTNRPDLDLRFVMKPPPCVRMLFPTKQPVPRLLQSDIVYSAKCSDCGDTYVGKTERQCARRLREHGAPKSTLGTHPNGVNIRGDDTANESRSRLATSTMEAQEQVPTLRRSSRLRKKKEAVVETPSNQNTNRKIEEATDERKKQHDDKPIVLSALAEHEKATGHRIDWSNVRILWRDNIAYRLLVKESLVIRAHQPALNRTTHSVPLLIFPEGLDRDLVPAPNGRSQHTEPSELH